ncbi:TRAP transporter small permease [Paracoccus xiamenensis]|uniref:TRAP transporter small permease n=1 Tax=Paracoccus xiamenensis TaxID=2714901 RepID=UPI00140AB7AF|nr:TRAP transporter small permease [Paracoccus xiamenensis]NHF72403.1 TRAP transporter small permease [Paracoccus xiamenensis]
MIERGTAVIWVLIEALLALLLAGMIILVFTNVVMRYGFNSGLRWGIELSRLAFVWIAMLGSALALRSNEHLAVTEVVETFLPNALRPIWVVTRLVIIGLLAIFVIGCWRQMNLNWVNISQVTGLPTALIYMAGVVGGGLMIVVAAAQILNPVPFGRHDERPIE